MNYLWGGMILIGIIYGTVTGHLEEVSEAAIQSSKEAVSLCVVMAGVTALWVGMMRIAEKSDEQVRALVGAARDAGVDFFDHADIYGPGLSTTAANADSPRPWPSPPPSAIRRATTCMRRLGGG